MRSLFRVLKLRGYRHDKVCLNLSTCVAPAGRFLKEPICFVILCTARLLNLIVNEEENGMTILLMISRSVFLISVVLYLYYFSRRKKHDVVINMWVTIVVGMTAGLSGQLIGVYLGNFTWASIQISFYLYFALIIYSLWKLTLELKKRRD